MLRMHHYRACEMHHRIHRLHGKDRVYWANQTWPAPCFTIYQDADIKRVRNLRTGRMRNILYCHRESEAASAVTEPSLCKDIVIVLLLPLAVSLAGLCLIWL